MVQKKVAMAGTAYRSNESAKVVAPTAATEVITVAVKVPRRNAGAFAALLNDVQRRHRGPCTRAHFCEHHGGDPSHIRAIQHFAGGHGLTVVHASQEQRVVKLRGTASQFNAAFDIKLQTLKDAQGVTYRGYQGQLNLPADLGFVVAVMGLDSRPVAKPHFRIRKGAAPAAAAPDANLTSFTPLQIASLYKFPAGTGAGQCAAVIELGGGYNASDLSHYFSSLGISPAPTVVAVGVDGATNAPTGSADGADGEVGLDIEIIGALIPGGKVAAYFAPNTDAGFVDAITTAVHDTTNDVTVISISWGGPEDSWAAASITSMNEAFQEAVALGIHVCVASGDSGSSDGESGNHVDFPASSPYVLGCGGTTLNASATAIASEVVWNDGSSGGSTGGGVSTLFAVPTWQSGLSATPAKGNAAALTKRGVPDVAGNADPSTGWSVYIDGAAAVFGGTSAVAPLWAALIARLQQIKGGSVGFLNPVVYGVTSAFRDITSGNNTGFAASKGWDACTGLGSPIGTSLATAISVPAPSPTPTPTPTPVQQALLTWAQAVDTATQQLIKALGG